MKFNLFYPTAIREKIEKNHENYISFNFNSFKKGEKELKFSKTT